MSNENSDENSAEVGGGNSAKGSSEDSPKIRRLDRMQIGTTPAAKLVARILRAINPDDASQGIDRLAQSCLVNGWTVYRWLRGTHTPRVRQLRVLEDTAKELGVPGLEAVPAT